MDLGAVVFGLCVGAVLGVLHQLGLWLTLRRLPRARRPALLLGLSMVARLALVLAGVALVALIDEQALFAALAGLVVARLAAMWWVRGRLAGTPEGAR